MKFYTKTGKLKSCPHIRVEQRDAHSGILAYHQESRRCVDCGLEEESYFGSYKTPLGKAEFIKHIPW